MFITKKKFEAIINEKVEAARDEEWQKECKNRKETRQRQQYWELKDRLNKIERSLDKLDGGIKDPGLDAPKVYRPASAFPSDFDDYGWDGPTE